MVVVPPTFKLPLTNKLFKLVDPDTFNDDNNVDEPKTSILEKLVLLFKLLIDNNVGVEKLENVVLLHQWFGVFLIHIIHLIISLIRYI